MGLNLSEKPELKKAKEKLLAMFASKERGALVEHAEIEKLIGIERGAAYYRLVRWAGLKNQESRGISVIPEPSLGYLMATSEQQLGLLRYRTKIAKRHIVRGTTSVESLPEEDLTDFQRRTKVALAEIGKLAASRLQSDAARDAYLMRPKPAEPLKVRMRTEEEKAQEDTKEAV